MSNELKLHSIVVTILSLIIPIIENPMSHPSNHKPPAELLEKAKHWREDINFHQDVLGQRFDFATTWGIFSPQKLDDGSLMLLDYIDFEADDDSIVY